MVRGWARKRLSTWTRFGDPDAPPALLMMGGGAQVISWPDEFCAELARCASDSPLADGA
ncbi:MAG TPA: hypothetical protein VGM79_01540 [Streptosporangiaceae bacterium]|jgi:hypothetical protein